MTGTLYMMGGIEDHIIYEDIFFGSDNFNNNNSSDVEWSTRPPQLD